MEIDKRSVAAGRDTVGVLAADAPRGSAVIPTVPIVLRCSGVAGPKTTTGSCKAHPRRASKLQETR
jgi:hypothetical protein